MCISCEGPTFDACGSDRRVRIAEATDDDREDFGEVGRERVAMCFEEKS